MADTTEPKAALPQIMPAGGQVVAVVPQSVEEIFRLSKGVVQSGLAPYALTGKTDTPEKMQKAVSAVAIVIMAGAELSLPPMVSLRSFTAINGRPALYGDGLINVVRRSGRAKLLKVGYTAGEDYRLFIRAGRLPEPEGDTPEELAADRERIRKMFEVWTIDERTGGFCEAERNDTGETKSVVFTVAEAKQAGLWQDKEIVKKKVWQDGENGTRGRYVEKDMPNDSPWFRYRPRMLGWRAAGFCLRELFGDVLGGITDDWEAREIGGMVDITPQQQRERISADELPQPPNPKSDQPSSEVAQNSNSPADAAGDFTDDASQLHNSDQPEGGENEAQNITENITHPATGEPMIDNRTAPDLDTYFARVEEEVVGYETETDFNAAWVELKVEQQLVGNDAALDRAEAIRRKHLARIEGLNRTIAETEQGQGSLLDDLPEAPMTHAQKGGGTP